MPWCRGPKDDCDDAHTWCRRSRALFTLDCAPFCSLDSQHYQVVVEQGDDDKAKMHKFWDHLFASKLRDGPFETFKNVKECDIGMELTVKSGETMANKLGFGATKNANVQLTCDHGNFFALSAEENEYLSHLLIVTYWNTHSNDNSLFNLNFLEGSDGYSNWVGAWGCNKCDSQKLRGGSEKAWADAFVAGLAKSPYAELKAMNKCMISFTLTDLEEQESA